jgi:hypothetical protein
MLGVGSSCYLWIASWLRLPLELDLWAGNPNFAACAWPYTSPEMLPDMIIHSNRDLTLHLAPWRLTDRQGIKHLLYAPDHTLDLRPYRMRTWHPALQSDAPSGDGGSSSNAPDDEIRQLVQAQRTRAIAAASKAQSSGLAGPRGGAIDLEGVTLEEVLGQGSFGVVSTGDLCYLMLPANVSMGSQMYQAAAREQAGAV